MKYSEKFTVVSQNLGYSEAPKSIRPCSGGCIHDSSVWKYGDGGRFFVKYAPHSKRSDMLRAEYQALQMIDKSETVKCPEPHFFQIIDLEKGSSVLVMEFLDLQPLDDRSGARLGKDLAEMHQSENHFVGLGYDNFIGATPQKNQSHDDWAAFFWEQRLVYQLNLASERGYQLRASKVLESVVMELLQRRNLQSPRLLHGDLWGGNAGALRDGTPVVFDPACYYGDPETDLAFTEVFGGFPSSFYSAYFDANPKAEGYGSRKLVYNLYHYLNHLNLFGSGYLSTCERIIQQLSSRSFHR